MKEREKEPREDMMSDLVHAHLDDEENPRLTFEERVSCIRALLIDKDGTPNWSPAALEDVSNEMVEACFVISDEDGFRPINPFL